VSLQRLYALDGVDTGEGHEVEFWGVELLLFKDLKNVQNALFVKDDRVQRKVELVLPVEFNLISCFLGVVILFLYH
jgi:hypothetical protein